MWSVPGGFVRDEVRELVLFRLEAGSNTFTVALPVVGGDEMGTPCSWEYKHGDLALQVGKYRI
jgi:hypothetical protein